MHDGGGVGIISWVLVCFHSSSTSLMCVLVSLKEKYMLKVANL